MKLVEIEFEPGDTAYIMIDNAVHEIEIKTVITATRQNLAFELTTLITYQFDHPISKIEQQVQGGLFATKKELIDNL